MEEIKNAEMMLKTFDGTQNIDDMIDSIRIYTDYVSNLEREFLNERRK